MRRHSPTILRQLLRALATTVGVLTICAFVLTASASAHSQLIGTSPAPDETLKTAPRQVVLSFDESVGVAFGGVRIYGPDGKRVDDGAPKASGKTIRLGVRGTARGTYAVGWRALSGDTHPIRGAFVFHVGEASGSAARERATSDSKGNRALEIAFGVARALMFLGITLGAGGVIFYALVQPGRPPQLVRGALLLALLSSVAAFVLDAANAGGFSVTEAMQWDIVREQLSATYGRASAIRALLILALLVMVRHLLSRSASPRGRAIRVSAALAVLVAASPTLSSHALVADPMWLRVPADMLHSVAAAIWIGGLLQLAFLLGAGDATLGMVRGFSRAALASVIVLVVTGSFAALDEIGWSQQALLHTDYGQRFLIKIALFFAAVGFAALNRQRVLPKIVNGVRDAHAVMRRYVIAELIILIFVIGVTAMLVATIPAKVAAEPRFVDATKAFGKGTIQLTIEPARQGVNLVHVYVFGANGAPDGELQDVKVVLSNKSRDISGLEVDVQPAGPGHFTTASASIPFGGSWTAKLSARKSKFEQSSASVAFRVRAQSSEG